MSTDALPPIIVIALLAAGMPAARGAEPRTTAAPAPAAAPQALEYRSAWSGYRPWSEPPQRGWRTVNDQVARVGGWRSYQRQVRDAAKPAAEPSQATP